MNGLIVEGVTGAGKTSIIAELERTVRFDGFYEDATFDDFMGDLERDPAGARLRANERMAQILDEIASVGDARSVLIERFHFSHVALDEDWQAYDDIDRRCAALGFKVALLTIPTDQMASRALYRAEFDNRDWQGFVARYGSEASALQALEASQQRRVESLQRSRLEYLVIETTIPKWPSYAAAIAAFAGWSR